MQVASLPSLLKRQDDLEDERHQPYSALYKKSLVSLMLGVKTPLHHISLSHSLGGKTLAQTNIKLGVVL